MILFVYFVSLYPICIYNTNITAINVVLKNNFAASQPLLFYNCAFFFFFWCGSNMMEPVCVLVMELIVLK